jgi:hypothetical protein
MEANKGKAIRGSRMGYRVFVLSSTKSGGYSVRRVGRLLKGMTTEEVMDILRGLAPRKSTTAVAVTKTGSIHLAARARKRGGKTKTSAKVARLAAASPKKGASLEFGKGPKGAHRVKVGRAGKRVLKPKASKKAAAKKTSR